MIELSLSTHYGCMSLQMDYFDHSVAHDQREIIPLLLAAFTKSAASSSSSSSSVSVPPLRLVASPWSPPGWMKVPLPHLPLADTEINSKTDTNKDANFTVEASMAMVGSSQPNGLIASPEVMSAWALYISYFIDAYAALGVPIWAVTPQNEPEFPAPWEACSYNATFERAFIDGYLGPQLESAHPEV